MKTGNAKVLHKRFPFLPHELDCGDGWCQIILDLSEKIKALLLTLSKEEAKRFRVTQVKEKFGGLRYYTTSGFSDDFWKSVYDAVEEATQVSFRTCETCGRNGKQRKHNEWIHTECDRCDYLRKKKNHDVV